MYARTPQATRQRLEGVWSVYAAADAQTQRLLLDGILARANTSQRAFASELLRKVLHVDFVALLPTELALQVLLHLDARSLCRCSQVRQTGRD